MSNSVPGTEGSGEVTQSVVGEDQLRRDILEACPAGMLIVDDGGRIVESNRRIHQWFEFSAEELRGQPVEILIPEKFAEAHVRHRERYLREPQERRMGTGAELLGRARSGREFAVDVSLHPLEVSGKRYVLAYIIHVAEQSNTERIEIDNQAARLSAILDNAVEGIVTIDDQGTIESVNPAAEGIFGYRAAELIGENVKVLMSPPFQSEHDGYIRNYLETGERKVIGIGREAEGLHRDGYSFPIDLSVGEVRLRDRRIFIGIVRDITERKRMEQEIRDERDFARSLIETAQAIVLVLDPDGRIVSYNRYTEELTGYSLDEVQGRDWFDAFIDPAEREHLRGLLVKVLSGHPVLRNVNAIQTRDGRSREIAWWARALRDASGQIRGVLSVGHDLTELNQARQRALQAERLAVIGQMVAGLAHESRNAIQRAQACQEMLALDVEDQPELMDLIRRTQHALDDLHRLYEEVRGYSAPIKLNLGDCHLPDLWREVWNHLELVRGGRPIRLQESTDGVSLVVRVDRDRIQQVLRNILENALAVSPEDSLISIHCRDTELDGLEAVEITIRDEGPGFTAEQADRVFEPFFTTKKKGTGLGMAIAKRIVDAHGGRIRINRDEGSGAAVIVTLPRNAL